MCRCPDIPVKVSALLAIADKYKVSPQTFKTIMFGKCSNLKFARPLSWDLCYDYFYRKRNVLIRQKPRKAALKTGALELYTYLSSFGMLRGSLLLNTNRLILIDVLDALFQAVSKFDFDPYTEPTKVKGEHISKLVAAVYTSYRNSFQKAGFSRKALGNKPTDTMISKILMGTLGVLPAFDQNFCAAAKAYNDAFTIDKSCDGVEIPFELLQHRNKTIYDVNNESDLKKIAANLKPLLNFVADPDVENFLRDEVGQIFKNNKLISTEYPAMRLLDLYFWGIGAMISPKKEKQESGQPPNGKLA